MMRSVSFKARAAASAAQAAASNATAPAASAAVAAAATVAASGPSEEAHLSAGWVDLAEGTEVDFLSDEEKVNGVCRQAFQSLYPDVSLDPPADKGFGTGMWSSSIIPSAVSETSSAPSPDSAAANVTEVDVELHKSPGAKDPPLNSAYTVQHPDEDGEQGASTSSTSETFASLMTTADVRTGRSLRVQREPDPRDEVFSSLVGDMLKNERLVTTIRNHPRFQELRNSGYGQPAHLLLPPAVAPLMIQEAPAPASSADSAGASHDSLRKKKVNLLDLVMKGLKRFIASYNDLLRNLFFGPGDHPSPKGKAHCGDSADGAEGHKDDNSEHDWLLPLVIAVLVIVLLRIPAAP